jgi:hypothetical protein
MVDCDGLYFFVFSKAKITQFGVSFSCNVKIERIFLPNIEAIIYRSFWNMLIEGLIKMLIFIHHANIGIDQIIIVNIIIFSNLFRLLFYIFFFFIHEFKI